MDVLDFLIETTGAAMRGYPKVKQMAEMYIRVHCDDIEVPVEEFLETYDLRICDYNNKQDDIKLMKKMDFHGVYIIHNHRTEEYYYGVSENVFRKVYRIFNRNEGDRIFPNGEKIASFSLRLIDIERTLFNNADILKNVLEEKYDGTFDSIREIFARNESTNIFLLNSEEKLFRHIYTIHNNEETFYGKSNYIGIGSNRKIEQIRLYNKEKIEIGIIKRIQFCAPWNKKRNRDIKILLKNENEIILTTEKHNLKSREIILPNRLYIKTKMLGLRCYVEDKSENMLISIQDSFDGIKIEFNSQEYKMLAICIALSRFIDREW